MPPGWCIWAVLLLVGGVLILLNILRTREENRRRQSSSRETGDLPPGRRDPQTTDLDRFLREVHRRRRIAQEEGAPRPTAPPPREPRPATQPVSRSTFPPSRRPSRLEDRPSSRRPNAPSVQAEVIPLVIPVEEPSSETKRRRAVEGTPAEFPPAQAPPPASAARPATSPAAGQRKTALFSLLNTRQALRNAIILREILDPPLCRRHRRAGF